MLQKQQKRLPFWYVCDFNCWKKIMYMTVNEISRRYFHVKKNDNEIINLWSSSCDNQRVPSFKKKICLTYPQTQVYLSSKFHCSNLCQIWDLAETNILSQDQKRTNGPVKHLPSAYQAKWNSQWNQLNSLKTCFVWNLSVRTESDDRLNTSH